MSEKKAFMLYLDYKQHLELLTDAERGMLMMALFDYAADKTEPTTLTGSAAMAFSFIRAQMDRDNQKYEEKCITNRANGAKGGRPKKEPTESDANPKEPMAGLFQTHPHGSTRDDGMTNWSRQHLEAGSRHNAPEK